MLGKASSIASVFERASQIYVSLYICGKDRSDPDVASRAQRLRMKGTVGNGEGVWGWGGVKEECTSKRFS